MGWNGRLQRTLIGLLLGLLMGCGIGYLGLLFFNLSLSWIGRAPVEITWGSVLPFGILVGLAMAVNMMNPPFGD